MGEKSVGADYNDRTRRVRILDFGLKDDDGHTFPGIPTAGEERQRQSRPRWLCYLRQRRRPPPRLKPDLPRKGGGVDDNDNGNDKAINNNRDGTPAGGCGDRENASGAQSGRGDDDKGKENGRANGPGRWRVRVVIAIAAGAGPRGWPGRRAPAAAGLRGPALRRRAAAPHRRPGRRLPSPCSLDVLQGGLGADYFDCGDGVDIVIDSNVSEGDDSAGNCEELLNNIVLPSDTSRLDITG